MGDGSDYLDQLQGIAAPAAEPRWPGLRIAAWTVFLMVALGLTEFLLARLFMGGAP